MNKDIDIKETNLYKEYPEAFLRLLRDHSRFHIFKAEHPDLKGKALSAHDYDPENLIIWATDDYVKQYGEDYSFHKPITAEKITGEKNGMIIQPRCKKTAEEQTRRVKDKAEVFTPSWVCNAQNNLVDEAWFGRKDVFNTEITDENGKHTWVTNTAPITEFPEGKTWKDYVRGNRMEITCGEAPYLASRYDTTTGEYIPTNNRIGLLDRKLRIISENCDESEEWIEMAKTAYKNIYGYEWQGDNLLLARESLLVTFLEFYHDKFKKKPTEKSVNSIAYIISWNLWQIEGLKMVIPDSCNQATETGLFGDVDKKKCLSCEKGEMFGHVGIKCIVKKWNAGKDGQHIEFVSLINRK